MLYLVTGGAGFIGSHLAEALCARGDRVRVLDDLSSGRPENLDHIGGDVALRVGSITDADALAEAAAGADGIFHLAARVSVPRSVEDPVGSGRTNVEGTTRVLLAARDAGCRRVVIASSSSIYGDATSPPVPEDARPHPLSPYAAQKLMGEHLARMAHPLWGVHAVSVRFFNVFGPRQDPSSAYAAVIPKFLARALGGSPPRIFGDGLQSRDFTFVSDAAAGMLCAMDAESVRPGRVFNIAGGRTTTVLEVARTLAELAGRPGLEPIHDPPRAGDIRHSHAAVERAREELGFVAAVPVEEGLARTATWFREQREERR